MSVGHIIRGQLFSGAKNSTIVLSWGSNSFEEIGGDRRGLSFAVNGRKFTGYVSITLSPNDTYDIKFHSEKNGPVIHEVEDVYVENMVGIIDEYVEK